MSRLSRFFAAQDMSTGKPYACILQFTIPLLIGNFAQQMYSTVDSIIVGQYVGDNALAAIGVSFPLLMMVIVLFLGIATGTGIMVSQFFGAKKQLELSKTVGSCIVLTALASLFIMVVGPLTLGPLLTALDTPDDIFQMAWDYLFITFIGIAGLAYYNILSGVLRGLGDAMTALGVLVLASVLNIALDLLFVIQFDMGVMGVAIATSIAQWVSAALCFVRLARMKHIIDFNWKHLRPDKEISLTLIKLGVPAGLAHAIFSVSALLVQTLTNSFGTLMIACSTVVMRVDGFAMMPNFSFNNALSVFTGQNIGAGRLDRVKQGSKQGTLLAVGCATLITSCLLLFGRQLMGLFTDTPELIDLGYSMMQIISAGYIIFAVNQALCGVMSGAGDTLSPMLISIISTVVFRVPAAYLIAFFTRSAENPNGDPASLFYSLLIAWTGGALMSVAFYKWGKWRTKSVVSADTVTE